MNNFILLIPLLAILGGVGLSFDSAFAADYTLDQTFCNTMGGSWSGSICTLDQNYTLSAGDEMAIPTDTTLIINAEFNNEGKIFNDWDFIINNNGNIINNGEITNNFVIVNNDTIDNNGLIINTATIYNHNLINNDGTINNDGDISNYQKIKNDGEINNNNNGYIDNHDNLINNNQIINNGAIYNLGTTINEGTIDNDGTLENTDTINNLGTINNYFNIFNFGTLDNQGAINNAGGTITNDGTITGDAPIEAATVEPEVEAATGPFTLNESFCTNTMGGSWSGSTCTLDNSYILSASDTLTIPEGVTLINNDTLNNEGDIANYGTIYNYGLISSEGDISNDGLISSEGTIDNDGLISNIGAIVNYDTINNEGTINNDGTINNYGNINNNGEINNYGNINNNETINGNDPIDWLDMPQPPVVQPPVVQPPVQTPTQNNEFDLTAAVCEQAAVDDIDIQWTAPILSGYAGTCIINNEFEGTDRPGETLIVSQDVILLLRNAAGGIVDGAMMQVDGALVLENTVYGNQGLLQVDGYLHIDEDSTFYNIGTTPQSITYKGQTSELTGMGELIVGPNADVLLESELKNSGLIDNAGAFDINMCSGSVDNIGAATITNVENGVVNEIACNNQPVNPPANPGADTTAPVISVPRNAQLQVETAGAVATQFFRATAVDETDGNVAVNCNFPQNNKYRVGTSTITCSAVDNSGNTAQKSFSVTVAVADADAVTCGTGTELFAGECRAIPVRNAPVVQPPVVQPPVAPQVQETVAPIGLIATVTDNYENGVTTLDIKFNKNFVNYEIEVTQNGDTLLRETDHALGTSVTYKVTAQGSVENPIDVKLTSLGIGLPGQESRWTGPTGLITNVQVVPEFGTIAMMILVVAIVSIVAVTSKSRLIAKF